MKNRIEKLVSKHTVKMFKAQTLEEMAQCENDFTKKLLEAINYTHSCTELNTDEKEQHFNNGFAQGYNDATNDILSSI